LPLVVFIPAASLTSWKVPIPPVPPHLAELRLILPRRAPAAEAGAELTVLFLPGAEDHVVQQHEVERAVVVQVHEAGAAAPVPPIVGSQTGGLRDLGEASAPLVPEKRQPAVTGEQQIREAVAVDVPDRTADPVPWRSRKSGRIRDLFEAEIPAVPVQGDPGAANQQHVEAAVVVVVEKGAPAPERLLVPHRPGLLRPAEPDAGAGRIQLGERNPVRYVGGRRPLGGRSDGGCGGSGGRGCAAAAARQRPAASGERHRQRHAGQERQTAFPE
jgi:hypothetical protein